MKHTIQRISAVALLVFSTAHAQDDSKLPGLHFIHHDWELVCDNTRTCRAAGYHSEEKGDAQPVSLLLTRKAGPNQAVRAQLNLGDPEEDDTGRTAAQTPPIAMRVNGVAVGDVRLIPKEGIVLSAAQTAAVLAVLPKRTQIEWQLGDRIWRLSDLGATAVLLKMDEFQGRVGTPGALVKKGTRNESDVLPALPATVVRQARLAPQRPAEANWAKTKGELLLKSLRAALGKEECEKLFGSDSDDPRPPIKRVSTARLNNDKFLVSASCWLAAYNAGSGYWVVDSKPPYHATLVTTSATDYDDNGILSASHKGRGIGDCFGHALWVWDGREFVHAESSTTGMCRMVSLGGTWTLPRLVSDVKPNEKPAAR